VTSAVLLLLASLALLLFVIRVHKPAKDSEELVGRKLVGKYLDIALTGAVAVTLLVANALRLGLSRRAVPSLVVVLVVALGSAALLWRLRTRLPKVLVAVVALGLACAVVLSLGDRLIASDDEPDCDPFAAGTNPAAEQTVAIDTPQTQPPKKRMEPGAEVAPTAVPVGPEEVAADVIPRDGCAPRLPGL